MLNRIVIFISSLPKTTIVMITDIDASFSSMCVLTGENKGMIKSNQLRGYAKKILSGNLVLVKI